MILSRARCDVRFDIKLLFAQVVLTLLIYALPVLLPAWPRVWPAAWIFLGLWFAFWLFILVWLLGHNPDLFRERMQLRAPNQKGWDRFVGPLLYLSLFLWLLFSSYDAGHFHWSHVALWVQAVGAMILIASFYLFFLTFRENSYLSPLVRIQDERGQTVISTGPYSVVRHPMYAATLAAVAGSSLLLGSWYGLCGGSIVALVLAWRVLLEERALQKELLGYADYMARVRHRLVPYVW